MISLPISQRVRLLRAWMRQHECQAFIVPTMDPHNSEYVPAHWQMREWITGFTGSAGTAVITLDDAALWTDSRYFLQAAEQLRDTPFTLMRQGEAGTPDIKTWIEDHLSEGDLLLYLPDTFTEAMYQDTLGGLAEYIDIDCAESDPFDQIYPARPAIPASPVEVFPERLAGKSAKEALQLMRKLFSEVSNSEDDVMVLNDASEVAWMLNLRANDIEYNPVVVSYFAFSQRRAWLFIDADRLSPAAIKQLHDADVKILPYKDFFSSDGFIRTVFASGGEFFFADTMTLAFIVLLDDANYTYHFISPFIARARALKTDTELEGMAAAHVRDGVAMVRLLAWLDRNFAPQGIDGEQKEITELDVSQKIEALRREHPEYLGPSFETIAAYGAHGAIVHYEPTAETSVALQPRSFLLLDTGAHYVDGTTDVTRTIPLGPLTDEERRVYTLVLIAHLNLALSSFPVGTPGLSLDNSARRVLWQHGYDYGHGTGHGVGTRLCVHEGPHQIRKNACEASSEPFFPNMVVTDEPGVYQEGKFGVRLENVLYTVPNAQPGRENFLVFLPFTLVPFDLRPVKRQLLDPDHLMYINDYHALVRERIMPFLTEEPDREWLRRATRPISY